MATRKAKTNDEVRKYVKIDSYKIKRANETKNGAIFFDLELNGVTIYGCTVVKGRNGEFISFPSKKSDRDGKYYSIAYAPIAEADADGIIQSVYDLLDN